MADIDTTRRKPSVKLLLLLALAGFLTGSLGYRVLINLLVGGSLI